MEQVGQARVDVAFPLIGERIPLDHGYALFGAICRVLGDLHGAGWLAIHPVSGMPVGRAELALKPGSSAVRVRLDPARLPQILPLAGARLTIGDRPVRLGVPSVHPLATAAALRARLVVIKGFTEPEPFSAAVGRQLEAMQVSANTEIGRRRITNIAGDKVVGFGVTLTELDEAASYRVQSIGVGGRQRMGCGVFARCRPSTRRELPLGAER